MFMNPAIEDNTRNEYDAFKTFSPSNVENVHELLETTENDENPLRTTREYKPLASHLSKSNLLTERDSR